MKNSLQSITQLINKKICLLSTILFLIFSLQAQVPLGHYAIFEFNSGSLTNSSTSGNFSGSALATADRFGSPNAIITSGSLTGVGLGATNFNNSTLCFWIKTAGLISTKRVIQMYGDNGNGYRVELDGTNLTINARATASTALGATYTDVQNLDDNTWHHIAVRTSGILNNTQLRTEVFVDGILTTICGDIDPSGLYINNFLKNASISVDPLNSYNARIDDIYMYKDTLTDAEIFQIYDLDPPLSRAYVNINATGGNNDGSSWADAYTDIRTAFINATVGVEIWVAEGTYIRQNVTDRNSVFGWTSDYVKVYGGFKGIETMLSERDWRTNQTILSGDIGTLNDFTDNCYTVFAGPFGTSANVINYGLLDGFTVKDGYSNAAGSGVTARGGGFTLQDYVGEMEFRNCTFSDNQASQGGAIYANSVTTSMAKITIEACEFSYNKSGFGSGVMFVTNGKDLTVDITNSLFHNNLTFDFNGTLGGNAVIYIQTKIILI